MRVIQGGHSRPTGRLSPLDKLRAGQAVIRELGPRLGCPEFRLLTVLVDETVGWSRETVVMTSGELATRCNMCTRSVRRATASLVELGAVEVTHFLTFGSRYRVDLEAAMSKMKFPKRVRGGDSESTKGGQRVRAGGTQSPGRGDSESTPYIELLVREQIREQVESPSPSASVEEVVSDVERLADERARRARTSLKASAAWTTWERAHRDYRPDHPRPLGWTTKAKSRAEAMCDAWPDDDAGGLHHFLDWVVMGWDRVVADQFSWMTNEPPANPAVVFLAGHLEKFHEAWTAGAGSAWEGGPHAREVEDLIYAGWKEDEAVEEVERRHG